MSTTKQTKTKQKKNKQTRVNTRHNTLNKTLCFFTILNVLQLNKKISVFGFMIDETIDSPPIPTIIGSCFQFTIHSKPNECHFSSILGTNNNTTNSVFSRPAALVYELLERIRNNFGCACNVLYIFRF